MIQQAELMAASFSDTTKADQCLDQLKKMEKTGAIDLIDAAVLVKQPDGKLKINEIKELTPKKGRRRGAIIGGVFGAIFPPSILISAVAGAVAGGALGRFTDQGMDNEQLKSIGDDLKPGQSAIIAIVEDKWVENFTSAMAGYDKLSELALSADEAGTLIAATDTETGETVGVVVTKAEATPESTGTPSEAAPQPPTTASEASAGDMSTPA
jgi:uncharacterized membrane protein